MKVCARHPRRRSSRNLLARSTSPLVNPCYFYLLFLLCCSVLVNIKNRIAVVKGVYMSYTHFILYVYIVFWFYWLTLARPRQSKPLELLRPNFAREANP